MKFPATLQLHGKTATGFEVPAEIVSGLGAGKRPPVKVTIGKHTYRSTIAPMGGVFMIGVSAENRQAAGVAAGDHVEVNLASSTPTREVTVPADFAAALDRGRGQEAIRVAVVFAQEPTRIGDRGRQDRRDPTAADCQGDRIAARERMMARRSIIDDGGHTFWHD